MKKLTIFCDMDAILADLLQAWLDVYNTDHNDHLIKDDITAWNVHEHVKAEVGEAMYKYLEVRHFYRNLKVLPGSQKGLKAIHDMGHNVIIASASANAPSCASEKIEWIREHFPFIGKKHINLGHQKHLLFGDMLIDDGPINIKKYKEAWPNSKMVTIAYPYNLNVAQYTDLRAENYKDTANAWDEIVEYVKKVQSMG